MRRVRSTDSWATRRESRRGRENRKRRLQLSGHRCWGRLRDGSAMRRRNTSTIPVPAEFKIRTGHDGYPDFYVRLDASRQKVRQDFTLERLAGVRRNFPPDHRRSQPAKAREATRFEREAMVDVRRTAARLRRCPATAWRWATSRAKARPARGCAPFAGDGGHSGLRAAGQRP